MLSESPCTFAIEFEEHTYKHMILLTKFYPFTLQQILFGLLALVGILVFTIACWRIIHSDDK